MITKHLNLMVAMTGVFTVVTFAQVNSPNSVLSGAGGDVSSTNFQGSSTFGQFAPGIVQNTGATKISSTGFWNLKAVSDNTITLQSPNGGDQWPLGTKREIFWTARASVENVVVELSRNDGNSWEILAASVSAATGTTVWEVTGPEAATSRIRITDLADNTATAISADPFSIVDLNDRTLHFVDKDAFGFNSGSSWMDAFLNLQDALAVAGPSDEIWVAEGTYHPTLPNGPRTSSFVLRDGVALYGGFKGDEESVDGREKSPAGASSYFLHETVLSGDLNGDDLEDFPTFSNNQENTFNVVMVSNTAASTIMDGFTISGGHAEPSQNNGSGAGMYGVSGSPTVRNCTFKLNFAISTGGAIALLNSQGPMISQCLFVNNRASNGAGAVLWANLNGTISNSVFTKNTGSSSGGIQISNSASPTIFNCIFIDNEAIHTTAGDGGAISITDAAPTLINCLLFGNSANINGGGIFVKGASSPQLINCLLYGNTAGNSGGGIFTNGITSLLVTNSILWQNMAADSGNEIHNENVNSLPVFNFCDIKDSGGSASWNSTLGTDGGRNIEADPKFLNANDPDGADNLLFTVDDGFRLQFDSPCVDAGTETGAPMKDILGALRPQGMVIDMGAYEFFEPASISGKVWNDLDHDGVQDEGEPGLDLVTINLFAKDENDVDRLLRAMVTDTDGNYAFPGLVVGSYFLEFLTPIGMVPTSRNSSTPNPDSISSDFNPVTGQTEVFSLDSGEEVKDLDGGYFFPFGRVVNDEKINHQTPAFSGEILNGDRFGASITEIGDIDGNGVVDLAVGSSGDDDAQTGTGTDRGAVWIILRNADGSVLDKFKLSDAASTMAGELADNDFFGVSVASLGDLDGNGVVDLAVGASGDGEGVNSTGAVWILFLEIVIDPFQPSLLDKKRIRPGLSGFVGPLSEGDRFGISLANIGDLNKDGVTDIAVGASKDNEAGNDAGTVWILLMDVHGTVVGEHKIFADPNDREAGAEFGHAISGLGFFDDDDVIDIAVGAPFDNGDNQDDRGAIWLLTMNQNGTVKTYQNIRSGVSGFTGELEDNDEFGISISNARDLDGNGVVDLLVGATGDDDEASGNGNRTGAIWALYLNSDGTVKEHLKISDTSGNLIGNLDNSDRFGTSVAVLGEIDQHGEVTAAVGAILDNDGGITGGAVWFLQLNAPPSITIGDFVWQDINGNGIQDQGEPGIENVKVELYSPRSDGIAGGGDDVLVDSVQTNSNGSYEFITFDLNRYFVQFTPPSDSNLVLSPLNQGADETLDSDGSPGNNRTDVFVVDSGGKMDSFDAGFVVPGTVKSFQKISDLEGGFGDELMDGDAFGYSITPISDLDGNGVIDLAVGAEADGIPGQEYGAIWILLLNEDGTVKNSRKITSSVSGFTGVLNDQDRFGFSVASIGDLNEDGNSDLAVGAVLDDDGGIDHGAIWILFLNEVGEVENSQKISSTSGNFLGTLEESDHFGGSVSSLGDLDNDGTIDIAVGAIGDDDGGIDRGAVWILSLNKEGMVLDHQKISSSMGDFGGSLQDEDRFGNSIAYLGDLNGDGVGDLAVGSDLRDGNHSDQGSIWILFLEENGMVKNHQEISESRSSFTGELDELDLFGRALSKVADLNGDGVSDLAIGADVDDDGGMDRGAVWFLFLNSNGTVKGHQKISSTLGGFTGSIDDRDRFGAAIAELGDINNDGIAEIVVGAYRDDDSDSNKDGKDDGNGMDKGAIWILHLNGSPEASTGGFVWHDANDNGIQDLEEPGLAGIEVMLFQVGMDGQIGGLDDFVVGEQLSVDGGQYLFPSVNSGDYYIEFVVPPGLILTQQNQSTDDFDSDADPVTGRTEIFGLTVGEIKSSIDAGFKFKTVTPIFGDPAPTIPEGGTNSFGVQLDQQPFGDVTLEISKIDGNQGMIDSDQDIVLESGSTLTFTPDNWDNPSAHIVTFRASSDNEDSENGSATFRFQRQFGDHPVSSKDLVVTERDDDILISTTVSGVIWSIGTQRLVEWTAPLGVTMVKIEIECDGQPTDFVASTPAAPGAAEGVVNAPESNNCRLKITDVDATAAGESPVFEVLDRSGLNPILVDVNASGRNIGGRAGDTVWVDAFISLQDALAVAGPMDKIWVAEGTYSPSGPRRDQTRSFGIKSGVTVLGGFTGSEAEDSQRDFVNNQTILTGDNLQNDNLLIEATFFDNSYHVLSGNASAMAAVVDGVIVTGGMALAVAPHNSGAGLFNDGGIVTLKNCIFSRNRATSEGGGIYNSNNGEIRLENCIFYLNNASQRGAAVYHGGSNAEIINSVFSHNFTANVGGGIYSLQSTSTITNCTFSFNSADQGAGIYNNSSSPVISNSIFWGNISTGQRNISEISIFDNDTSTSQVTHSLVRGNFSNGTHIIDQNPFFLNPNDPDGDDNLFYTSDDGNQLDSQSPAIDAGDALSPEFSLSDILGEGRFDDGEVKDSGSGTPPYSDLGAYERQASSDSAQAAQAAKIVIEQPKVTTITYGQTIPVTAFIVHSTSLKTIPGNVVSNIRFLSPSGEPIDIVESANDGFIELTDDFSPNKIGRWILEITWFGTQDFKKISLSRSINVERGTANLVINKRQLHLANTDLNVSGLLSIASGNSAALDLSGIPVQITLFPPPEVGGSIMRTVNTISLDGETSASFTETFGANLIDSPGDWKLRVQTEGNQNLAQSKIEESTFRVTEKLGYAILCQGSIQNQEGVEDHRRTMNFVKEVLHNAGIRDNEDDPINLDDSDTIFDSDMDGDLLDEEIFSEDVFDISPGQSKTVLQDAITIWAKEKMTIPAPLYLIVTNHGGIDQFHMFNSSTNSEEILTPEDLHGWLSQLTGELSDEGKMIEDIIVVLGMCFSGSFIDTLSTSGRILLSASSANERSIRGPGDSETRHGELFVYLLFRELNNGTSLLESFVNSQRTALQVSSSFNLSTNSATDSGDNNFQGEQGQHALLDDNGDGKGSFALSAINQSEDEGFQAQDIFLVPPTNGIGSLAIERVHPSLFLGPNETILPDDTNPERRLWAEIDAMPSQVQEIFLEVKLPGVKDPDNGDASIPDSMQASLNLEKQLMIRNDFHQGNVRYEWPPSTNDVGVMNSFFKTDLFDTPGVYQLFYYAKSPSDTEPSQPGTSFLYRASPGTPGPSDFGLLSPPDKASIAFNSGPNTPTNRAAIFIWEESSSPNPPVRYLFRLWKDKDRRELQFETRPRTAPFVFFTSKELPTGTFFWDVVAIDSSANFFIVGEPREVKVVIPNAIDLDGFLFVNFQDSVTSGPLLQGSISIEPEGRVKQRVEANGEFLFLISPSDSETIQISAEFNGYEKLAPIGITIRPGDLEERIFELDPKSETTTKTFTLKTPELKNVEIKGAHGRRTDDSEEYTIDLDEGFQLDIEAPEAVVVGDIGYRFKRWETTDLDNPDPENPKFPSLAITDATSLMAVYEEIGMQLQPKWNVVSTPVELGNDDVMDVLGTDGSTRPIVWEWRNGLMQVPREIEPGKAYLVRSDSNRSIETRGQTPPLSTVLRKGWNFVAVKGFHPINAPQNPAIMGRIWEWDPDSQNYCPITDESIPEFRRGKMFPAQGYWIYAVDDVVVNLGGN